MVACVLLFVMMNVNYKLNEISVYATEKSKSSAQEKLT